MVLRHSAAAVFAEDQRLCVLRTLDESPQYKSNEGILQAALQIYGHSLARDKMSTMTSWLEEQGLVSVEDIGQGVRVVTITSRGIDVAQGVSVVPGVKRPRVR